MTDTIGDFDEFDPESSILFLGSGFSLGARDIEENNPPNGRNLRQHFINLLGMPADTTYDLQILTEEYADQDPSKIRDELYRIFRIKSLDNIQKSILGYPWRRIYSTNYDDAVELYRISEKKPVDTFDVSDGVPAKLPHGAIIHLHGSIRLITPENVMKSLVLGETSYVNQYVVRSPWYDQFQRDIAFATRIYIVGYNLGDYHIAALLMADPALASRTIFIQGPTPDPIFVRRTAQYGRTQFIGTEGFAASLAAAPRPAALTQDNLRSFRSLSATRDKKATARPTAPEIHDLLVFGDFDPGRLARSQPSEDYAIARRDAVRGAADTVERKAALVVDGRLGNGKTIFLHLLAFELTARGWTCLIYKPGHPDATKEIAALKNFKRLVIIIDQYSSAQDNISGLREALPEAKLVVEVRTGTFEVRFHELVKLLPSPLDRISLSTLSQSEIKAFARLCEKAGLHPPIVGRTGDLRDMLLDLYNHQGIREKVRAVLAPLFDNRTTRRILTMTMLIAMHQGAIGAGFVRSVVGEDPFAALKPLEDLSSEIFHSATDNFRTRSAVFSTFVLNTFIDPDEIANVVVEITLAAARRRNERPYRVLMSNMMAYASLRRMLHGRGSPEVLIASIYERLRFDERISIEPLFWLQYAIAMADVPKLATADEFIGTAYRKARELSGFQTYQIDTQAFRIALMRACQEEIGRTIFNIDRIITGLELVDNMLGDSSQRSYAIRVLEDVPRFVATRRGDLNPGELTTLQFWLVKVAKSLSLLPADFKTITDSETTRRKIEAALASFVAT